MCPPGQHPPLFSSLRSPERQECPLRLLGGWVCDKVGYTGLREQLLKNAVSTQQFTKQGHPIISPRESLKDSGKRKDRQ